MEMGKTAAIAACGLLVVCCAGCKSAVQSVSGGLTAVTGSPQEPKWVSAGAAAFPEDAGKALYGVGFAPASRFAADPFMARQTTEERGREEIAGELQALVASVISDYAAAAFAPGIKPDEMRSLTDNVQEAVAEATLDSAKAAASWTDPQTGASYMLMKLSLNGVAEQLRDRIIAVEDGKLKMDPAAAHKELGRIIQKDRKPN
jgi:hypothetical protein